jgi:uncharacterized delta-60 repeat protein
MGTSVVIVDSRVTGYQTLIDGLSQPVEVLVLNAESDGLSQIATYLQGRSGIDAVHIISHGSQGALQLGSTVIDSGNLGYHGAQLASIGSALTSTGDILLYGCNVAQGDVGLQFIASVAQYTGADVAASSNATGSSDLGGDSVLEQATGNIEVLAVPGTSGLSHLLGLASTPIKPSSPGRTSGEFVNSYAFAALRADGSVVTWGDGLHGGDSSAVASKIDGTVDVVQVFSTGGAFAALRADGSVVTWGDGSWGGDSSAVASKIDGTVDVVQVFSTGGAFAALRADGSLVTWGGGYGGDSSAVASKIDGTVDVVQVFSTGNAFAALRADGSVVTWGDGSWGGDSNAVASKIDGTVDVVQVFSTNTAFAALRADGSLVTWGYGPHGGDSSAVASKIDGTVDVVKVFSNLDAFAALYADGSVVTWGVGQWGGDSSAVASKIDGTVDVVQVFSTADAFAALRADGSVVTWGGGSYGADSSAVASKIDGTVDVVQVFSTNTAFSALRADGSVVTWGVGQWGGDSSAVASKIDGTVDVVSMANPFADDRFTAGAEAKTGKNLVDEALLHLGQEYSYNITPGQSAYANASYAGPWDCSEFVSWLVDKVYDKQIGLRDWNAYTGYWAQDATAGTLLHTISLTDARNTPGAIIYRFDDGLHHIAISQGNGKLIEANVNFHNGYYWSDNGTAYAPLANGNPPSGVDIGDVRERNFDIATYSAAAGWAAVEINGVSYTTTPVTDVPPVPGADDFAASTATTGVLSLAAPATGKLELAGDKDWFKIDNLVAGHNYQITVEGTGATPLSDTFFSLRNAAGGVVIGSASRSGGQAYDDAGPGTNALVQFTADANGTHYVAVGGGGANYADLTGGYRMVLTEVSEPDATPASASAMVLNAAPTAGFVGYGADSEDYYSFVAPSDGTVTAHLTGVDAQADLDARLMSSAGNPLGAAGDNPSTTVTAGQTYYVKVTPHNSYAFGDQSPYSIDVDFVATVPVDPAVPKNAATLFGDAKLVTLANFALAAYDIQRWEPLAIGAFKNDIKLGAHSAFTNVVGTDLWHAVDLPAGVLPTPEPARPTDFQFGFEAGVFTNRNAAALVAISSDSLVISFRGTNDNDVSGGFHTAAVLVGGGTPDEDHWLGILAGNANYGNGSGEGFQDEGMADHYALFADLISQTNLYVAQHTNIQKVYVVGHSLGAAMVNAYMQDHPNWTQADLISHPQWARDNGSLLKYEAVTFADPGYSIKDADNRITNFLNDSDIINIPDWVNATPGDDNWFDDDLFAPGTSHSMKLYLTVMEFLNHEHVSEYNIFDDGNSATANFDNFVYHVEPITQAGSITGFLAGVGPNFLRGTAKNDVLVGGPGNDVLVGDVGNDLLMGGKDGDTYRFAIGTADVLFFGNDSIFDIGGEFDSGGEDKIEFIGGYFRTISAAHEDRDVLITVTAALGTVASIRIKNYDNPENRVETIEWQGGSITVDALLMRNVKVDPTLPQIVANAVAVAAHQAADAVVATANANLAAAQMIADAAEAAALVTANAALAVARAAADAAVVAAHTAADAAVAVGNIVLDGVKNAAVAVDLAAQTVSWIGKHTLGLFSGVVFLAEAFTPPDDDSVIGTVQSISGFVDVIGTDGDDEIIGDSNGNVLTGGAGNDLVQGGGGDDFLIGGSGAGNDTYQGGDGIDTVVYTSATQGIVVNLAAVIDQASGPEIGVDQIAGIENVIGGQGDDSITGDGVANVLSGESGNDSLVGGGGNDTLVGGPGDDNLDGDEGIDTAVFSGAFADYVLTSIPTGWTLTGPDGRDTLARLEFARFADQLLSLGNFAPAGTVAVSGTPLQAQTLTANTVTLTDVDGLGTFSYQWKADNVAIDGAAGATLLLTQPQVGKAITVGVSYTDGHGTVESVGSIPTTLVANVNDAPIGSVTITGTVTQGQTLTATNTLADLDGIGTISYQWSANGARIVGATNSTLPLGQAQVGKTISVTASYTDGFGTAESVSSNATGTIGSINHAPTFAPLVGTGIVTTDIANGSLDLAYHMDLQSDGKILVAGIVEPTAGSDFALVRYNADGSLDQTFNGTGIATLDFGGTGVGEGASAGVFQLPDGKIVVGGNNFVDFALARYNADGSLDTSFGTNGKVTTAIGFGYDIGIGMVVQPNGKILLSGWSTIGANDDFSLVRYNADGTLDSGFGSGGKVATDFGGWDSGYSVALQADGKIVMSGQHYGAGNDFAVARYTSTGSLDPSFGAGGKVTTDFGGGNDFGSALIVQFDGKIVVAGGVTVGGNWDFGLMRYNTDGSVDTTFGSAGKVATDFGGTEGIPQSGLAQQADGKLLVLGTSKINGVTSLAFSRYNTDGSLDVTFSADGKTLFSTGFGDTYGHSIKLRSDGKILVSCSVLNSASNYDFAVVRFNTDGSLDTGFGAAAGVGNTLGGTISYTEHTSAVALDTSVAVLDSDLAALVAGAGDYNGAIVALARVGGANPEDQFSALGSSHLSFTGGNAVLSGTVVGSVVNSNGSLSITFNHSATQAVVNDVLSSIAYANSSSAASSTVQIGWTFNDGNTGAQGTGGALQDSGTTTVNVVYAATTPVTPVTPAGPATIGAATPPADQIATEGGNAVATYHLSAALPSATTVKVSVNGQGGATLADYSGFSYHLGASSANSWFAVPASGLIIINAGAADFQLKVTVAADHITEAGEALAFAVAQTTSSVGLTDSWWVPCIVQLQDAVAIGAKAIPRSITASTTTPADEPSSAAGNVNHAAAATYNLSGAGTDYASTEVHVSLYGLGGVTTADYNDFAYRMGASGAWISVPASGLITVDSTAGAFQLSANVLYDTLSESNEALSFNVAQTTSSVGLTDSWWVPSIVGLQDAVGTGARAIPRSIAASATTPADEPSSADGNVNHAAIATYSLSGAGTGYASTEVRVSLYGLAGATPADYSDFAYRMGTSGAWISVPASGLITVGSTAAAFQLSANVLYDTLSESNEALSFNVAQTTSSVGLTDSWWVPSIVDLADAIGQGASALPRSITATSTTTAIEASSSGNNANHAAVATYNLSGSGAGYASTEVHVKLDGQGGATLADYSDFSYRMGTSGAWISVPASGLITIGSSEGHFQLSANVLYDTRIESNEVLSFTVAQTNSSIGLIDSWWVQSVVNLADADPDHSVFTGGIGSDRFTAIPGVAELFIIPVGSSLAQTGRYDTIAGIAVADGDKIDAPGGILGSRVVWSAVGPDASPTAEAAWVNALGTISTYAPGELHIYRNSTDAYIWVNDDGNTAFNVATDTFIKLVGSASLSDNQIASLLI